MAKYEVLLVGDGSKLLNTMQWVLEYKGFAVQATANPEAALEALVKKNYDLVIAKLNRDDQDALDILKRAKRLNPEVKLMILNGKHAAWFPLEAFRLEVNDYLMLPVTPTELWRRVSRCLEDRQVVDLEPVPASRATLPDGDEPRAQAALMLHDIRATMVATAAHLKLMARGRYGGMSDPVKTKVEEMSRRMEHLINLTEEFVGQTARHLGQGDRDEMALDLQADIVEPVLVELAPDIHDQNITLVNRLPGQMPCPVTIRGSRSWLKCVFRNLISNGIKHGGQGCTIMLDLETRDRHCRLNVYNTGAMIPEDKRSMLFMYAASTRPSRKGRQGLGVGLSLSRDLLRSQGGDIWYEARQDGSSFVMSLPQA